MRHHSGTFHAFWGTLAVSAFLALTLSSCAVTVAMPGSSASTPTLPATRPSTPAASQPTQPDESAKEETNGTKKDEETKEEPETPTEGKEEEKEPETPQPEPEPEEPKEPETPAQPKPGDHMTVPTGYNATWEMDGNTLVLKTYTPPISSSINLKLPTGGKYKLAPSLFAGKAQIENVEIPEDVIEIGAYAFQNTWLKNVKIPESVKIIGDHAFEQTQLQELTLKGNYTAQQIGTYAFANCSQLERVVFEGAVTALPDEVFQSIGISAENSVSIKLPNGLETIGRQAFGDSALQSIYIPASVTKIDSSAFENCWDLTILFGGTEAQWN